LPSASQPINCLRLQPEVRLFVRRLKPKNRKVALIKIALAEALRNYAFFFFWLKPSL